MNTMSINHTAAAYGLVMYDCEKNKVFLPDLNLVVLPYSEEEESETAEESKKGAQIALSLMLDHLEQKGDVLNPPMHIEEILAAGFGDMPGCSIVYVPRLSTAELQKEGYELQFRKKGESDVYTRE